MTLPAYIEQGAELLDATGHAYRAEHSGDSDEWGNPKLKLIDMNPSSGASVPSDAEWTVSQLQMLRFKVKP